MGITAPQRHVLAVGETRNVSVSFDGLLDTGEILTGTPTVIEQTTSDLTVENVQVSSAELTILGETVAIGRAVQFSVVGQLVASSPYELKITAVTDSTPAQTVIGDIILEVEA